MYGIKKRSLFLCCGAAHGEPLVSTRAAPLVAVSTRSLASTLWVFVAPGPISGGLDPELLEIGAVEALISRQQTVRLCQGMSPDEKVGGNTFPVTALL
jgi:hypothetical protein